MKKTFISLVSALMLFLLFPVSTFPDVLATENFDSYSNGDNIFGKAGGSGWSANWNDLGGAGSSEITNTQAQSGTLSMTPNSGHNPYRDFTQVDVGSIDFYFYQTSGDSVIF